MKILIIDDDEHWLELIAHYLQQDGYDVRTAISGRRGMSEARRDKPDLIICDIGMPDGNGYEFVRDCKRNHVMRDIVVLACTGSGLLDTDTMAREVGFDGSIIKSNDHARILKAIREHLKGTD